MRRGRKARALNALARCPRMRRGRRMRWRFCGAGRICWRRRWLLRMGVGCGLCIRAGAARRRGRIFGMRFWWTRRAGVWLGMWSCISARGVGGRMGIMLTRIITGWRCMWFFRLRAVGLRGCSRGWRRRWRRWRGLRRRGWRGRRMMRCRIWRGLGCRAMPRGLRRRWMWRGMLGFWRRVGGLGWSWGRWTRMRFCIGG